MEPTDLLSTLHRAGEAEQKRLVPEIAAEGAGALSVLAEAYETARTGRLRCCILDAISAIDDPRVLPILASGLTDESSSVRCHAVAALVERRDPVACNLLLPLLQDPNAAVRCRAIDALAQLECRSPDAVAALIACAGDADWRIRQAAARALGDLRATAAEPCLRQLRDDDPRNAVRKAAEAALALIGGYSP